MSTLESPATVTATCEICDEQFPATFADGHVPPTCPAHRSMRAVPCARCGHKRIQGIRSKAKLNRLCPPCVSAVRLDETAARREAERRAKRRAERAAAKAAKDLDLDTANLQAAASTRPGPTDLLTLSIEAKGFAPRVMADGRLFVDSPRGRAIIETSQDLRWLCADLAADTQARAAAA